MGGSGLLLVVFGGFYVVVFGVLNVFVVVFVLSVFSVFIIFVIMLNVFVFLV